MNYADLERHADDLIRRAGLSGPPYRLRTIADMLGIEYETVDLLIWDELTGRMRPPVVPGWYLPATSTLPPLIQIVSHYPRTRRRFTMGHELGEHFYHPAPSALSADHAVTVNREHEQAMNWFSACLLMPRDAVWRECRALGHLRGQRDTFHELARRFGVSIRAMSLRLADVGCEEEGHVGDDDAVMAVPDVPSVI